MFKFVALLGVLMLPLAGQIINGGGSSGSNSVGNCESAGSTPGNCYPFQQTVTQSSGTLTAILGSATLDSINITTLSANVTTFNINNPSNGEIVMIYDCQAASGGPYTIASPSGWPTIPVHPLAGACLLATYQYYNSSNIQLLSVISQGTAPGVCFSQTIVASNPPSGDYYSGCTSTSAAYWLDSSGNLWVPTIAVASRTAHQFVTNITSGGVQSTAAIAPADLPAGTVTTLTDGSTVTWAIGSVLNQDASLTFTAHSGSRTLNITGPVTAGNYVLELIQDGTGGEGLTLGTGCTWKVANGGSEAVTLSTGPNALDVLTFVYDGTNCLANLVKNLN